MLKRKEESKQCNKKTVVSSYLLKHIRSTYDVSLAKCDEGGDRFEVFLKRLSATCVIQDIGIINQSLINFTSNVSNKFYSIKFLLFHLKLWKLDSMVTIDNEITLWTVQQENFCFGLLVDTYKVELRNVGAFFSDDWFQVFLEWFSTTYDVFIW